VQHPLNPTPRCLAAQLTPPVVWVLELSPDHALLVRLRHTDDRARLELDQVRLIDTRQRPWIPLFQDAVSGRPIITD